MKNMESTKKIFRFDDVCINSDMVLLNDLTNTLFDKFTDCDIIWAISPIVCSFQKYSQRIFPKKWNAVSDNTVHYNLDSMGIPLINPNVIVATHGLVHADHRLMDKGAQELSIALSKSLIDPKTKHFCTHFVPPFNKWNKDTENICNDRGIELVKFEDGWMSGEFEKFNNIGTHWYFHAREWTLESFKKWIENV